MAVLDDGLRERVRAGRVARFHRAGHAVFRRGDEPLGLTVVCRGSVRMLFTTEGGRQVTAAYASCGEFIGEGAYLSGTAHVFTAEALGDAFTSFMPRPLADELLSNSPALLRRLAENSSGRFCAAAQMASDWLFKSADARLAELLLDGRAGRNGGMPCMPDPLLTRQGMAERLGLAPETVIRRLGDLKRRGVVRFAGRSVEVLDRETLSLLARNGCQASEPAAACS